MSSPSTYNFKPLGPEQIEKLREELYAKKNGLDTATIDRILALPPDQLIDALRGLVIAFGPLSAFSVVDYPYSSIILRDGGLAQPDPIVDEGDVYLEGSLDVITTYNKFIEDRVSKFNIQTIRSLAGLREEAASEHDLTPLRERSTEAKQRRDLHEKQIELLRNSLDSADETHLQKLEEFSTIFFNEVLFLSFYNTYFDKYCRRFPGETLGMGIWDEHDYVLEHVQRWRRLVNVKSPRAQEIIDGAREHVNQLVMSITHQCQVQLATVFHESQTCNTTRTDHHVAVRDEAIGIIKEIDWLWEEVIPVAHMTVSAQFLKPVIQRYRTWDASQKFREAIIVTYASGILRFMNQRLSAVAERTQILVYHHQALYNASWFRQIKKTSNPQDAIPRKMPRTMAHGTQPDHYHTASESLQALMQIYGVVPINVEDPFPKPSPSLLDEYVQNRAQKGDIFIQDLHKLFEGAVKAGLTERELGGELLLESLLADSSANMTQPGSIYQDTELDKSIEMLRAQAQQVQNIFRTLNLDGPAQAPEFVAHAYRQTSDRLAAKVGERCFRGGENPSPTCMVCIRCLKFEEFVRKWGC
ncbi:hypothetical protein GGS21DRAFT_499921 [Xylaria nigripes]|nr:hypothetical protein GGS21DRAFT_499921 [Xylaria nigripes]